MASRLVLVSAVAAFCLAGSLSYAEIYRPALCKEKKTKAAGKRTLEILTALGRTAKKPDTLRLMQQMSKAESKFSKAISKAEAGGCCVTSGDAAELDALVAASVIDIIAGDDGGEFIIWTSQNTEHPVLGGLENITPTGECGHPWALVEVSWTSQQLGADCRYKYQATWLCLDSSTVETEHKTEDRTQTCLTFG